MATSNHILNCSTSLENYHLCIEEKVAGFPYCPRLCH